MGREMQKAQLDHLECTASTGLDVHVKRTTGEDELQPSNKEFSHLVLAGTVPHGNGEPFLRITAMGLGGVREASEDLGRGLSHLRDHEPVSPALQRVSHEGSELAVGAGCHRDRAAL